MKRSKEEAEADPEEEDEYGYTTSEYKSSYVLQTVTVTVDLLCFVCVMRDASACRSLPVSLWLYSDLWSSNSFVS